MVREFVDNFFCAHPPKLKHSIRKIQNFTDHSNPIAVSYRRPFFYRSKRVRDVSSKLGAKCVLYWTLPLTVIDPYGAETRANVAREEDGVEAEEGDEEKIESRLHLG